MLPLNTPKLPPPPLNRAGAIDVDSNDAKICWSKIFSHRFIEGEKLEKKKRKKKEKENRKKKKERGKRGSVRYFYATDFCAGLARFHTFSSIFFVRVYIYMITPIHRGGRIVVSGLQTSKHDTKT
jgi:hypothetical protein